MLWTDGYPISSADLARLDSVVIPEATAQKIILDGASGVVGQAWTDINNALLPLVQSFGGGSGGGGLAYTVLGTSGFGVRQSILPNQIVTSSAFGPMSPLADYCAYYALMLFFTQAARRSEKTSRFEAKLEGAERTLKRVRRQFVESGLPIVRQPLSAPGAVLDPQAGSVNVTAISGGTTAGGVSYDVAVTWVDQTVYLGPAAKASGESAPSATVTLNLGAGQQIWIDMSAARPPGSVPWQGAASAGTYATRTATGWNVYAAVSGSPLILQNDTPLPLATTSYALANPRATSYRVDTGQPPDTIIPLRRVFA